MAESPPPDFEHNARAMRRVIEHLLTIGEYYLHSQSTRATYHPISASLLAVAPPKEARAMIRLQVFGDAQFAIIQAYDNEFKDSLKDEALSDPAAFDLHMDVYERKLVEVRKVQCEKVRKIGLSVGVSLY